MGLYLYKYMKNIKEVLKTAKKAIGTSSIGFIPHGELSGAVYFLMKDGIVVYIGATSNRNRIGQHQKDKDFDEVRYITFTDNKHWQFESELIRRFKTKYNKCNIAKSMGYCS